MQRAAELGVVRRAAEEEGNLIGKSVLEAHLGGEQGRGERERPGDLRAANAGFLDLDGLADRNKAHVGAGQAEKAAPRGGAGRGGIGGLGRGRVLRGGPGCRGDALGGALLLGFKEDEGLHQVRGQEVPGFGRGGGAVGRVHHDA